MVLLGVREPARGFRRPVSLIHGPGWRRRGFTGSVPAGTLREDARPSRPDVQVLQQVPERHERMVLICHSGARLLQAVSCPVFWVTPARVRDPGVVLCRPRGGHLFHAHYLAGIARGDYCNRRSRLYRHVRGREPADTDFMPAPARAVV